MKFYIANMGIILLINHYIRILLKHPVEWKVRSFFSWLNWGWDQAFLQGLWEGFLSSKCQQTLTFFFLGGGFNRSKGGLACTYVCEDFGPWVIPNLCSTHRLCRKTLETKAYSWTILSIPIIFFQRFIFLSRISKALLICFG